MYGLEEDDDPWQQHALYFDDCKYLRLIKGTDYPDRVITELALARIAKRERENGKNKASSGGTSRSTSFKSRIDTEVRVTNLQNGEVIESRECKICFENESNSVFIPCGHITACVKCASSLTQCPICRKKFRNVIKVYFE